MGPPHEPRITRIKIALTFIRVIRVIRGSLWFLRRAVGWLSRGESLHGRLGLASHQEFLRQLGQLCQELARLRGADALQHLYPTDHPHVERRTILVELLQQPRDLP